MSRVSNRMSMAPRPPPAFEPPELPMQHSRATFGAAQIPIKGFMKPQQDDSLGEVTYLGKGRENGKHEAAQRTESVYP